MEILSFHQPQNKIAKHPVVLTLLHVSSILQFLMHFRRFSVAFRKFSPFWSKSAYFLRFFHFYYFLDFLSICWHILVEDLTSTFEILSLHRDQIKIPIQFDTTTHKFFNQFDFLPFFENLVYFAHFNKIWCLWPFLAPR